MLKMFKIKKVTLLVLAVFLIAGIFATSVSAAEVNLIAATINRGDHIHTRTLNYLAELVEERSDGRLTMTVYPDAQLGGASELYEGTIEGAIDLVSLDPGWFAEHHEEFDILDSFYLFKNGDHYKEIMNEPGRLSFFEDLLRERPGLETIYYVGGFERNILSTFAINSIEDLDGQNFRSREVAAEMDWWSALGANPIPIAYEEVYTAIQTGTVEGSQSSINAILEMGFAEVAGYLARTQHVFNINLGVMNMDTYNSMDPELQNILKESAREAQMKFIDEAMGEQDDLLDQLVAEYGVTVTYPDTAPFVEASQGLVVDKAVELGIEDIVAEIFDIQ